MKKQWFSKFMPGCLLIALVSLVLTGCGGGGGSTPPGLSVTLNADPVHRIPPSAYQFTFTANVANAGQDAPVYSWDFGDGATDSGEGPKAHTYSQPGAYTVKVTVTAGSRSASATTTVGAWGKTGEVNLSSDGGEARKVFVAGNYAYVAHGDGGLKIVDLHDPKAPSLAATVGGSGTTGMVYMVHIEGDWAYLAAGNGIYKVNVSNPVNPGTPVQINDVPAFSLFVSGNYLYAGGGDGKLRRINLASSSLEAISDSFGASIKDVHVSGSLVFAATNSDLSGVKIIRADFIDGENPSYTITESPKVPQSVWVEGNYAYITFQSGTGSLKIYDISSLPPGLVGEFTLGSWGSNDVMVKNGYAYVADGGSGFRVIDVSNPSNPNQVVVFDTDGTASSVWIDGYYASVADWDKGMKAFCAAP